MSHVRVVSSERYSLAVFVDSTQPLRIGKRHVAASWPERCWQTSNASSQSTTAALNSNLHTCSWLGVVITRPRYSLLKTSISITLALYNRHGWPGVKIQWSVFRNHVHATIPLAAWVCVNCQRTGLDSQLGVYCRLIDFGAAFIAGVQDYISVRCTRFDSGWTFSSSCTRLDSGRKHKTGIWLDLLM